MVVNSKHLKIARRYALALSAFNDDNIQNELNSIFERFYKVDRSRSTQKNCTGLGLYIAKTIINLHNGEILAESKENDYTIFKVILPRNSKRGDLNERI